MKQYIALAASALMLGAAPVFAGDHDRMPTSEELAALENALGQAGYSGWQDIEKDDGYWEVDDAVDADGVRYDLKLDPNDLSVVHKEREDRD